MNERAAVDCPRSSPVTVYVFVWYYMTAYTCVASLVHWKKHWIRWHGIWDPVLMTSLSHLCNCWKQYHVRMVFLTCQTAACCENWDILHHWIFLTSILLEKVEFMFVISEASSSSKIPVHSNYIYFSMK